MLLDSQLSAHRQPAETLFLLASPTPASHRVLHLKLRPRPVVHIPSVRSPDVQHGGVPSRQRHTVDFPQNEEHHELGGSRQDAGCVRTGDRVFGHVHQYINFHKFFVRGAFGGVAGRR